MHVILTLFSQFELSHFFGHFDNDWTVGTLWAQLLQFYSNSFETLQMSSLKMCMWFGYDPQINFYQFSQFELSHFGGHFDNEREWTVGTLCAQLLQFYSDSSETLQMS